MRKNFLQKSYTNCGGETSPRTKVEHISGLLVYSFIKVVFIACWVEDKKNLLKLSFRLLTFTWYKAFLKKKNKPGSSLSALFSVLFF